MLNVRRGSMGEGAGGAELDALGAVCSALFVQLLLASGKLNFYQKQKVTGHPYVKIYALQLLFGTSFDISCRAFSRYKGKPDFGGFCQIGGEPGVFGSCIFDHRF